MMKKVVLGLLIFVSVTVLGFSFTVKIGTIIPADTPWDLALRRLGVMWGEITNGLIDFRVYSGGIVGDEPDLVRKARIGQLDGAALSGTGLDQIDHDLLVMSLPLFYENLQEVDYVLSAITDDLDRILNEKKFVLIGWTTAGWVHLFGKKKIVSPNDLMKQRLIVGAEDEPILRTWRAMGFDAIPIHITDQLSALQSGMADAFYTPPLVAASYQWFGLANHMSSLRIAPLIAGLILNERTWRRIPNEYKDDLLAAAREVLDPLYEDVQEFEIEAIDIMLENGLIIDEVTEEAMEEWKQVVTRGHELLVKENISPEIYQKAKQARDEFRANNR